MGEPVFNTASDAKMKNFYIAIYVALIYRLFRQVIGPINRALLLDIGGLQLYQLVSPTSR